MCKLYIQLLGLALVTGNWQYKPNSKDLSKTATCSSLINLQDLFYDWPHIAIRKE